MMYSQRGYIFARVTPIEKLDKETRELSYIFDIYEGDKIDKDKKLLSWLKDFSKEKIEDSYSQRIEDDIKALGKELFKENFQLFFPDNSESVYSRENLDEFSKKLNKIKSAYENTSKK